MKVLTKMRALRAAWRMVFAVLLICSCAAPGLCSSVSADEPSAEELKERVANTGISDRPPLCIRISEQQLRNANKFYTAGESDKAQAALTEVAAFSELARDYSIQAHKHEKQSEIAVRKMVRKLSDLKHTVAKEDQAAVQTTIDHLQKVRDDLLAAMFRRDDKK